MSLISKRETRFSPHIMQPVTKIIKRAALPFVLSSPLLPAQTAGETPLELDPTLVTASQAVPYEDEFEEVAKDNQVTAYKTGTPLIDVPQSVAVFTKEQIDQQGIDSVGDLVDYTPGVNTSLGEGHRDAVVFRGVRSTADFFADGVRDDVQYYRSLYNVDQVEVIKGPNALTFGRGGTGGVLNRSFKRAQLGENFGSVQGSIDTFGATSSQLDTNWSAGDWSAFRLNAHYDDLKNHRDFFTGQRIGVNPTFTFKLGEDTDLRFSYEYADHERFIDRGIPSTPGGRVARQFDDVTFGDEALNFNDLEAHTFRVSVDHRFNDNWKGRLNAFYGTYDKVYSNYFSSDFDGGDRVEFDGYVDRTDRQRFSLSGDLVGEFTTGSIEHKVLFGAEYINTSSDQDRFNNVWNGNGDDQEFFDVSGGFSLRNGVFRNGAGEVEDFGTFSDLNDDTESTLNVFSVFLQDEIAVSEKLDVILGARFDAFDVEVRDNDPDDNGIRDGSETSSNTDYEVSPRFGLVYKPVENLSIYGSYSETFLPRSGEQFSDLGGDESALDADTATNLEFGIKWDISDNLNFALSGFRIEQSTTENDTDNPGSLIELDSEIYGVEAQLKGDITDQWFISAGYTYLHGTQNSQDPELDGRRLRELPRHAFSLWNNYQVNEELSVGLGVIYQDESFVDNANNITLPSYVRVDLAARYDFSENFGVQLNVENLLDRNYFPNSHNNDNIGVGAPINARLTFSARF